MSGEQLLSSHGIFPLTDMKIAPAHLERWMRQYYFDTDIDLGSSGTESFAMSEICSLVKLKFEDLGKVVFNDSQTLGGSGLREALATRWTRGDCGRVMATQGSSEAIFLVMNALLDAGDEVVVLEPAYQQLYAIAESLGCKLKRWQLRFEQGFVPNLEELASLLNPKTRMVVVNFPHNPTGASVTANQQARLIEIVAKTGAYLVWDEAFADLVYDEPRLPDPNLLYERAVTLGTLSKAYGLAGLRVGWCLAAPDVLKRCVHLRDYTTLHLSPLVELIAQRVIESADAILAIQLKQVKGNLEIVSNWMKQHADLVEWAPPQGGVTFFPRLNNIPDVEAFCRRLAEKDRILLVPGNCFKHPQHVRLGFGGPTSLLEEGLLRLSARLTTNEAAYN